MIVGKTDGGGEQCRQSKVRRATGLDRQLIKLRGAVIEAREKWERIAIECQCRMYEMRAERSELPSSRAPTRRIYFIEVSNLTDKDCWALKMKKEIARLDERIASLALTRQRGGGRGLWLPKLMFDPLRIELTTYYYRSAAGISKSGAEAFVRKVAPDNKMPAGEYEYFLVRPARKEHRMRVVERIERKVGTPPSFKMPEWSVCFVTGGASLPSVDVNRVKPNRETQDPAALPGSKRTVTCIASKGQQFLVAVSREGRQKAVPVDIDDWQNG